MSDYRRHTATRPTVILFTLGSPEPLRWGKPRPYPKQSRAPWRPQRAIPSRPAPAKSQAGLRRLVDILSDLDRREAAVRRRLPRSI